MLRNTFKNIKSGMSLIEILIVITVIGILMAILVPQIGNTQAKTHDITRQTQVQELVAALMSYKLDYGEFPTVSSYLHIGANDILQSRGNIALLSNTLVAGGYMKKIPKDPAGVGFTHTFTEGEQFNYNSVGYYLYISDGKSFMIITPVEDIKNSNSSSSQNNIVNILQRIGTDVNKYKEFFASENGNSGGDLYIYKYEEEIL